MRGAVHRGKSAGCSWQVSRRLKRGTPPVRLPVGSTAVPGRHQRNRLRAGVVWRSGGVAGTGSLCARQSGHKACVAHHSSLCRRSSTWPVRAMVFTCPQRNMTSCSMADKLLSLPLFQAKKRKPACGDRFPRGDFVRFYCGIDFTCEFIIAERVFLVNAV